MQCSARGWRSCNSLLATVAQAQAPTQERQSGRGQSVKEWWVFRVEGFGVKGCWGGSHTEPRAVRLAHPRANTLPRVSSSSVYASAPVPALSPPPPPPPAPHSSICVCAARTLCGDTPDFQRLSEPSSAFLIRHPGALRGFERKGMNSKGSAGDCGRLRGIPRRVHAGLGLQGNKQRSKDALGAMQGGHAQGPRPSCKCRPGAVFQDPHSRLRPRPPLAHGSPQLPGLLCRPFLLDASQDPEEGSASHSPLVLPTHIADARGGAQASRVRSLGVPRRTACCVCHALHRHPLTTRSMRACVRGGATDETLKV